MDVGYCFEFTLDPKRVRYLYWDKSDDLKHFMPPYIFRAILSRSICSRRLANQTEKFLKNILVQEDEYKIYEIETEPNDIVVFKSLKYKKISEKTLYEFRKLFKRFCRGYVDVSDSIVSDVSRLGSDFKSENFYEFRYPSKMLNSASKQELELLIALATASNEIVCLTRLMFLCRRFREIDGRSFDIAVSQERAILHILAGKCAQSWEIVKKKYFASKLSAELHSKLLQRSQGITKMLNKYFGSKNVLTKVRNEFAFHYGDSIVNSDSILKAMGDKFVISQSGYFFNTIFDFAELSAFASLGDEFQMTVEDAVAALRRDVETTSTMICLLCHDIINVLLSEIARRSGDISDARFERYELKFDSITDWEGLPTIIHPDEAVKIASQLDQMVREHVNLGGEP